MKVSPIPMTAALLLVAALTFNQWRMHRALTRRAAPSSDPETESTGARLRHGTPAAAMHHSTNPPPRS